MSYACKRSYHYALMIIEVDIEKVFIMEPLDKAPEEYNSLIYMLNM
jgi:hypothetical protein